MILINNENSVLFLLLTPGAILIEVTLDFTEILNSEKIILTNSTV